MKIVRLQAENIKRLVAVEITPDGNVVQITGKNGSGKTSVLDSIWWALAGQTNIQSEPIRKGATQARVRLDMGELIVTRTFTRHEDERVTSKIVVETADGARFPSPQGVLDALLGELSFDPLAFARRKPREQYDVLASFVPGVDFVSVEQAQADDFAKRAAFNKEAKALRARADAISLPADCPTEKIDVDSIVAGMAKAGETNAAIDLERARRDREIDDVARMQREVRETREEVARLEQAIKVAEEQIVAKAAALNALAPLPEKIDVGEIQRRVASARENNELVRRLDERAMLVTDAEMAERAAATLTQRMTDRESNLRKAISEATLPIPGVTFGKGELLLNDVPLEQASDAEKLRASVAVAIALNPKLRVVRVRDGSLLDEDGLALLARMAEENDMQIWIERVDSTGKVGFVLEDGHLIAQELGVESH